MEKDAKVKIGFFMLLLAVLGFAIAAVVGHVTAQGEACDGTPVIDGDAIYNECAGIGKITVTPHTARFWDSERLKSQEIEIDSYGIDGLAHCGMILDSPPRELRMSTWAEVEAYRKEPVFGMVTENLTCMEPDVFAYTESPLWAKCMTENNSILFEGEVTFLDVNQRYFEWQVEGIVGSQDVPYVTEGWADRTSEIVHYDYGGRELYAVEVSLSQGEKSQLRIDYLPEFNGEHVLKWEAYCWQGELSSPVESISVDPWATASSYSWSAPIDGYTDIDTGATTASFTGTAFELGGAISIFDDFSSKDGWWEYNEPGGYSQLYVDPPNMRMYARTQRNRHDALWSLRNVSLGTDDYELAYQFYIAGSSLQVGTSFGLYGEKLYTRRVATGYLTRHNEYHQFSVAYTAVPWRPRVPRCAWRNGTHYNSVGYGYTLPTGTNFWVKLVKNGLEYRCELYSDQFQTLLWNSTYTAPNELDLAHVGADNGHDDYGGNWMEIYQYDMSLESGGDGGATSAVVYSEPVTGTVDITSAECSYEGTTPLGTALDVMFRAGNSPWYDCDETVQDVSCTSNCKDIQWKADLSTTNPAVTPSFSDITIDVGEEVGDLEVLEVIPIQTVRDVPHVKDKYGVIRTKLYWDSAQPGDIEATLEYSLVPVSGGDPISLGPPQEVTVFPDEETDFLYDFTPTVEEGEYDVIVEASTLQSESDDTNNDKKKRISVVDTHPLHVAYVPVGYQSFEFPTFRDAAFAHQDVVRRLYPLGEDDALSGLIGVPYQPTDKEKELVMFEKPRYTLLYNIMEWVVRFGPENPDRIAGIFPPDLFGPALPGFASIGSPIRTVAAEADNPLVSAHEIAHTFRLCDEYDDDEWETQNRILTEDSWPFEGCPNGDYDSIDGLDQACKEGPGCETSTIRRLVPWGDFVWPDTAFEPGLRNLMGAGNHRTLWIDKPSYEHLLRQLQSPVHRNVPERLMISGLIIRNGTTFSVEFEPIEQLEAGEIIEDDFAQGTSVLEMIDFGGAVVNSINFSPAFATAFYGGETVESNVTGFIFVMERPPDVTGIRLKKAETVIGEVHASENAPTVRITSPSGEIAYKEQVLISWEASDEDGDPLLYAVGVSSDGGENWHSLVADYPNTSVILNINKTLFDPSDSFLIRVRAMDGFLSTEDIMSVSFELNPECVDTDGDDVCDESDNCPVPNPLQLNFDQDELGDVCDPDDDNDGVVDEDDWCQFTVLPEEVPTKELKPKHYADIDGDGFFESVSPKYKSLIEDAVPFSETFGCSCEEILDVKPGKDEGELKHGCTKGTLNVWSGQKGWAK